jgi:signal transduction histidine kinase
LITTEERERRRVAVYLHDVIGQALAFCKIRLRSIQKSGSHTIADTDLHEILRLVDDSIKNTRSITFDLSPPVLYEMNFPTALRSLTEQLLEPHSIRLDFTYDDMPITLNNEVKVIAYYVVREIVVNCIKHARANRVMMNLTVQNGSLVITVADDGVGFQENDDIKSETVHRGFGLFNIRERLFHMGGLFEMHSNEGQGTTVTISIPMNTSTIDPGEKGT